MKKLLVVLFVCMIASVAFAQRGPGGPGRGHGFMGGRGEAPKMAQKAPESGQRYQMMQRMQHRRGQMAFQGRQLRFKGRQMHMRGQGREQMGRGCMGNCGASERGREGMRGHRGSRGKGQMIHRGSSQGRGFPFRGRNPGKSR